MCILAACATVVVDSAYDPRGHARHNGVRFEVARRAHRAASHSSAARAERPHGTTESASTSQ